MCLAERRVDHDPVGFAGFGGQFGKYAVEHAQVTPANEAVVYGLERAIPHLFCKPLALRLVRPRLGWTLTATGWNYPWQVTRRRRCTVQEAVLVFYSVALPRGDVGLAWALTVGLFCFIDSLIRRGPISVAKSSPRAEIRLRARCHGAALVRVATRCIKLTAGRSLND